jgi:ribonuclease D
MSHPALITTTEQLEDLCDEMVDEPYYAFDTEFHTERTYFPYLGLIQLAWADKTALVDPLAVDPHPLARLFSGEGIAVAHAAEQDLAVLRAACGTVPKTVFDTQVAAGFLGLSSPSLARLVEQMLGITLPKGDQLSDWTQRPLTERMTTYAAGDVIHLLALRSTIAQRLTETGRLDWALEECQVMLSERDRTVVPEEAWWKLGDIRRMRPRTRGVAQELSAWRERKAIELNRPRRTILSDLALQAIVQRPPTSRDELQQMRGVDGRHLAQGGAAEILDAIERGRQLSPEALRLPPEGGDAFAPPAAVAVCSGLVRHIADELDFDQALLATRSDIARLLCGERSRLDVGWRSAIAGDPIRALMAGQVTIAFQPDGGLVVEPRAAAALPSTVS